MHPVASSTFQAHEERERSQAGHGRVARKRSSPEIPARFICALGLQACRDNHSVLYQRAPKLFEDLALAHADGRYPRLMRALSGVNLLIIDDWGLEALDAQKRHDLLEIIEDRYGRGATLVTTQIPVDRWREVIGDPTYADAILDRLVHNAHRIALSGDSLRRRKRTPDAPTAIAPTSHRWMRRPCRSRSGTTGRSHRNLQCARHTSRWRMFRALRGSFFGRR